MRESLARLLFDLATDADGADHLDRPSCAPSALTVPGLASHSSIACQHINSIVGPLAHALSEAVSKLAPRSQSSAHISSELPLDGQE